MAVVFTSPRLARLTLAAALALAARGQPAAAQSGKGFLFKQPIGSFSLRGGYAFASAASDVFSESTRQLTLDKSDFNAAMWGGDVSFALASRTDIVFDAAYASKTNPSEFREFTDNNDNPIQQTTKYRRVPLSIALKYYLGDRGRSIGQFAYIPSKVAPFVSVGGGAMYYRFEQSGDFIDFNTANLEVFTATLESSGWAPMAQGAAGLDYTLGPWLALTGEGRYQWAKANLDQQVFEGFQKIDLSGFTGTVGFKIRF